MENNINVLVTGGAGFIGSALSKYIISNTNFNLVILDKLTYSSDFNSLEKILNNSRVKFIKGSIGDKKLINKILDEHLPNYIFNLAAETHVDNSISQPHLFIKTNILETHKLFNCCLKYFKNLDKKNASKFKFLQISTDEVYGDIASVINPANEETKYNPSSPYSSSKASADLILKSYYRTYNFPAIISNCSNNYGPYQHKEKFIPMILRNIFMKKKIKVYGDGNQIREWLYVDDHCDALLTIIDNGNLGENYNISDKNSITNLNLVKLILSICKELSLIKNDNYEEFVSFVKDRPGHDIRYALDTSKIFKNLRWKPKVNFNQGLLKTINFYSSKFKL
tara:strand:- start:479 stop:1492 length:1014 start_codon:yes stop_codon:yes gene_type:complete